MNNSLLSRLVLGLLLVYGIIMTVFIIILPSFHLKSTLDGNSPLVIAETCYKQGNNYLIARNYGKAFSEYEKALSINPGLIDAMYKLGVVFTEIGENNKAIDCFKKIIVTQPHMASCYYNVACIYARQNMTQEAIDWLRQSIVHGYKDWKKIKTDNDLNNIRTTKYYQELMKAH
jgi:tetratricopeptide (TPR) repeat protein